MNMIPTFSILNTGKSLSSKNTQKSEFWSEELVGYVVMIGTTPRVITGWGNIKSLHVGARAEFRSDQSNRYIGSGTVVGIFRGSLAEGPTFEGEVPPRAISHWVFK